MSTQPTRRRFLRTAAAAGAVGAGDWDGLLSFAPASADDAKVTPELVRFSPDIEPVVRLIEETPQDKCVAAVVEQLKKGLPYRNFLAGLYLAAIRAAKVLCGQPHGYDHSAYWVHAAYQLSLDLPAGEQLLPAFSALVGFKGGQKAYPGRKGTTELTGPLPASEKAEDEFHAAMRE